ncbi:hypothetical protein Tco_0732944 [Tanacetum coccineum]
MDPAKPKDGSSYRRICGSIHHGEPYDDVDDSHDDMPISEDSKGDNDMDDVDHDEMLNNIAQLIMELLILQQSRNFAAPAPPKELKIKLNLLYNALIHLIKRLLDDLEVTAVKVLVTAAKHKLLVPLVQKLLLLVLKVNAAGIKVPTTERLQLLKG